MAKIFEKQRTNFYYNWLSFIEDFLKSFLVCFLMGHSVYSLSMPCGMSIFWWFTSSYPRNKWYAIIKLLHCRRIQRNSMQQLNWNLAPTWNVFLAIHLGLCRVDRFVSNFMSNIKAHACFLSLLYTIIYGLPRLSYSQKGRIDTRKPSAGLQLIRLQFLRTWSKIVI